MRVLGVDPGTVTVGWGIVEREGRDTRFVGAGEIAGRRSTSLAERLKAIHAGLVEVIGRWRPQVLSLEKAFVLAAERGNVQSALRLGEARGVVLLAAAQTGIGVREYSPAEIKQAVVGYGRADKEQVQRGVYSILRAAAAEHALPTGKDATDALAAALCHAQRAPLEERIREMEGAAVGTDTRKRKRGGPRGRLGLRG